jgi:hypothetical protein
MLLGTRPSTLRNWGVQCDYAGFRDTQPTPGRPFPVPSRILKPPTSQSVLFTPQFIKVEGIVPRRSDVPHSNLVHSVKSNVSSYDAVITRRLLVLRDGGHLSP